MNKTGLVLEIHRKEPSVVRENCIVVQSDSSQLGIESAYDIVITQIINNGKLVVNCTLKPEINNFHLAERISKLEGEKQGLQTRIDASENENTNIKSALTELTDIIVGG